MLAALLTNEQNLQPFLASSPPSGGHDYMSQSIPQVMAGASRPQIIPPPSADQERARQGSNASSQLASIRSPVSTIAILPSSLTEYHTAYMKGHPRPPPPGDRDVQGTPSGQTEEQRAANARRLKPNFRNLPDQQRPRPEPMTALPAKKARPTKWQFGIRSRNQPAEAMLAIFKALKAMGADWEIPEPRKTGGSRSHSRSGSQGSGNQSGSRSRAHSRSSSISSHSSDGDARSDDEASSRRKSLTVRNTDSEQDARGRQKHHYNHTNDWGYRVPEDPWVINARFRKDGMFPPGVAHPSSTHSSRVDLHRDPEARRRSSTITSNSSHAVDGMTNTAYDPEYPAPDEAVWIYMSIQLYSIDRDFFVVDFKCAGYERLVSNLVREIKADPNVDSGADFSSSHRSKHQHEDGWDDEQGVWRRLDEGEPLPEGVATDLRGGRGVMRERTEEVGAGRMEGDKVCTSPFPFLDVASTLILQLSGE